LKIIKYYIYYLKNLFVLGYINIFTNRKKFKEFSAAVNDFKASYDITNKARYLRTIELEEIISKGKNHAAGKQVIIENWVYRQGNVSLYELYCLSSIAKNLEPGTIFEIGTFDGRTTLHFALNTGDGTKIHTLDLPPSELENVRMKLDAGDHQLVDKKGFRIGENYLDRDESKKVTQHLSDSASFDYSPFFNSIDLFFVDGAHSYDYVRSDTENALKTIKPGGMILWHDYTNVIDVTEYLNELSSTKPIYRINHTSIAVYSPALFPN
jgi:predicted O-methyltransferase YrrM